MTEHQNQPRKPSVLLALVPIIATLLLLFLYIVIFDDFTPHIPLVMGIGITGIVAWSLGYRWENVQKGMFHVVHVGLPSLAIILIIGMLIGSWLSSGTVPMLIYYGLKLINPSLFLATAMLMCSVVSVSLGTSWTTCGTIGLALMGVGEAFGIPTYWTAGAVISGAFFGDKISPLSDTTNLAPAVTETDLFDHIKNMLPTTIPAMLIALVIYFVVGFTMDTSASVDLVQVEEMLAGIESNFNLSPFLLLPIVFVIGLAVMKMPAIPSLILGVLSGVLLTYFFQSDNLSLASFHTATSYIFTGFSIETGIADLDSLLNRGGMTSMMWTLSLMMIALAFGGALERIGCMEVIIGALRSKVKTFAGIQTAAIGSSMATNIVSGDVYLSIALPGRMYAKTYDEIGYSRLNLARAIEEGGTLISPLVPWNAGGYFVTVTALGISFAGADAINFLYIPLSFACWLAPVFGIAYAHLGWFSPKAEDTDNNQGSDEDLSPATS